MPARCWRRTLHSPTFPPTDRKLSSSPRTAGVSSFGFSGTNAHVVVQQYAQPEPAPLPATVLLPVSAHSPEALQTALTEFGRVIAHEQGWYERRRFVQLGAVILVGLAAVAACGAGYRLARGNLRRLWLAILGASELGAFVIIRATSIHKVDKLIGADFLGVRVNGWLELGGISCIAFAAWRYRLPAKPRH